MKYGEKAPRIKPHAEWLWKAFSMLSAQRTYGDGFPYPIRFTEIEAYVRLFALDNEVDRYLLCNAVLALDNVFLTEKAKQLQKKRAAENNKKGRIVGIGNG